MRRKMKPVTTLWWTLVHRKTGAYAGRLYVYKTHANWSRKEMLTPSEWRIARVRIEEVQ